LKKGNIIKLREHPKSLQYQITETSLRGESVINRVEKTLVTVRIWMDATMDNPQPSPRKYIEDAVQRLNGDGQ
jgi:hypothetical protein